ncbi:MAG: OB-fold domain-containing protein [Chloroflexi bacterium]|nr:OB-fold domain-containing protein [Chloroflexota bacterium]
MPYMPEGMPLPDTKDAFTKDWWAHCKNHELVVQRCSDCGTFRHPPMPICHNCLSWKYEWHKVSGKGVVYSYTVPHYAAMAILKARVPYNVVLVELADAGNIRMVGNLIDSTPHEDIHVGMPVEIAWEDVTDDLTLPQWKRAT